MSESKKSARDKAAQARAEAQAKEKRRERMFRIIIGIVVVVVVGGIVGGAIIVSKNNADAKNPAPNASAALPNGVDSSKYFYTVNPSAPAGVPEVRVYEDFQCPHCKQFEASSGQQLVDAANQGKLRLEWQPGTFMDQNLNNQGSVVATSAWGCAINAGKATEYHSQIFKEQAPEESAGAGFTNQQMITMGGTVGITGDALTTFTDCVNASTYYGWAANSNQQFSNDNVTSTPTITVNGKPLDGSKVNFDDPTALLAAIANAAKS